MVTRYLRFPGGKRKALTFSYDDGVEQDIRLVYIFRRYHMKATFNINSGQFGPEDRSNPTGRAHRKLSKPDIRLSIHRLCARLQATAFPMPT